MLLGTLFNNLTKVSAKQDIFKENVMYLFSAALNLPCCVCAFSSFSEQGLLLWCVGLL